MCGREKVWLQGTEAEWGKETFRVMIGRNCLPSHHCPYRLVSSGDTSISRTKHIKGTDVLSIGIFCRVMNDSVAYEGLNLFYALQNASSLITISKITRNILDYHFLHVPLDT